MKYREQILKLAPEDADIWLLKATEIKTCRGTTINFPVDVEEVYFVDLAPEANWGHPCQFVGFSPSGEVCTINDNMPYAPEIPEEFLFREPPELLGLARLYADHSELLSRGRELLYVPYEGYLALSYGTQGVSLPIGGEAYQLDLNPTPQPEEEIYRSTPHPCLFFLFDSQGTLSIVETKHPMWPSNRTRCMVLPLQKPENKRGTREFIHELLQHPTLSRLEFWRPYLGQSKLGATITLQNKRELFGESERAALAVLLEKDPLFFEDQCEIRFVLEKIHATNSVEIEVNIGQRDFEGKVYNYINAWMYVFYAKEGSQLKRPVTSRNIAVTDFGYNGGENVINPKFEKEREVFFDVLLGWFQNWEKIRDELREELQRPRPAQKPIEPAKKKVYKRSAK